MHGPNPEARASAESSLSYLIKARSMVPSVRWREVVSDLTCLHFDETKPFFIKLRCLLQIVDLQRDMYDARHKTLLTQRLASCNTLENNKSSNSGDFLRQRKMNILLGETVLTYLGTLLAKILSSVFHQVFRHRRTGS